MGEQRGKAPLLTVDLTSVTVELNLRESGARFPCKWSSVLEIYSRYGSVPPEHCRVDAQTYPHGVLEPLEEVEKSSHKMEKPAETGNLQ